MDNRPLQPVPRAVLFDLDDTLCDFTSARRERLRFAFSTEGQFPEAVDKAKLVERMIDASIAIHPYAADHFPDLFADFGVGSHERAYRAAQWYRSNRFHSLQMFPAAVQVLQQARFSHGSPGNRPIGVITNGPSDVQRAKIELLDVARLVDFIIISEEFGAAKPDPTIFEAALAQAGAAPNEAVFIGDSAEHDMAGAMALGMATIWINRTGAPWAESGLAPDRTVSNISEVPRLIGSD